MNESEPIRLRLDWAAGTSRFDLGDEVNPVAGVTLIRGRQELWESANLAGFVEYLVHFHEYASTAVDLTLLAHWLYRNARGKVARITLAGKDVTLELPLTEDAVTEGAIVAAFERLLGHDLE